LKTLCFDEKLQDSKLFPLSVNDAHKLIEDVNLCAKRAHAESIDQGRLAALFRGQKAKKKIVFNVAT